MIIDSRSIFGRLRNHFSQLLDVFGVNDVRQAEMHTSEPLVPEPSAFEVEMIVEEVKRHRSPGTDQIPTELIKTGGRQFRSEIHIHINSTWNEEGLAPERRESVIIAIYKEGDKTDCNNYRGIGSSKYKILSTI